VGGKFISGDIFRFLGGKSLAWDKTLKEKGLLMLLLAFWYFHRMPHVSPPPNAPFRAT
jgi:hypothetical protein